MTAAEYDRIDDDGDGGVLDCPDSGQAFWDYGPIGPGDPRGRTADDALRDAIVDMNEALVGDRRAATVPMTGWVALEGDGDDVTFLHTPERWEYLVMVGGDAKLGVWRHNTALGCNA